MELFKIPRNREDVDKVVSRAEHAALLVPSPRQDYVEKVCAQAKEYGFAGVIATPYDCPEVLKKLEGSGVKTICLNALNHALDENFDCRMYGTEALLDMGVRAFELPVPCGLIRDGKFDVIEEELAALTEKIHAKGGEVSVILEPECMDKPSMVKLIQIAEKIGAEYIRLCSGLAQVCGTNGGRATVNLVGFVKEHCSDRIVIKAGGGWDFAYLEDCAEYIDCGAGRVDVGLRFTEQLEKIGYRRNG
jgi:deoxyribose-phosphate aldolase